ncbi:MAG TPA: hypothetical protein VG942_13000 [Hyphomonadaceae bacterium]|nr:hypothetical protein [Hyphomonadaceae bacterium]
MALTFKLTELSDLELQNLNGNASRLSQSGSPAQQVAATELLPKIAEEVSRRIDALQAKKAEIRVAKRGAATGRPRKR